jgi:hypothetical protein
MLSFLCKKGTIWTVCCGRSEFRDKLLREASQQALTEAYIGFPMLTKMSVIILLQTQTCYIAHDNTYINIATQMKKKTICVMYAI